MRIAEINWENYAEIGELVAEFRVELKSYKGIASAPDAESGRAELEEYLTAGYPVYAAVEDGVFVGYLVCRVEKPVVWVESVYVAKKYRRQGIASALFGRAEEIAKGYGESTVYNYVHPNNDQMIGFLKKQGYSVLNLIEIRKHYPDEEVTGKIKVGKHEFDY